jgi:UDP-glucose 4-epimerase
VPAFLEALLKNRPLPVHGDGLQTRDFTYVGTLVDALTKVVTRRATSHRPINLAFGTRTNLLELIRLMEDVTGESSMLAFEASRHGDVRDSQASNESLMDLLPDLEAVSLESGLRDTFNWMRQFLAVTDE